VEVAHSYEMLPNYSENSVIVCLIVCAMLHFFEIGVIGVLNLLALFLIILWFWFKFTNHEFKSIIEDNKQRNLKKHLMFALLSFATLCNIPLYFGFIIAKEYTLVPYSFHKLEPPALFAAYSLTINEWSNVLFEIQEDSLFPFLLRSYTLLGINSITCIIALGAAGGNNSQVNNEFKVALRRLLTVMTTIAVVVFIQVTMRMTLPLLI
jgi:hypothetical protein